MKSNYSNTAFVLVFKTNIRHHEDVRYLTPFLNSGFGDLNWSIDLSDIDRVLRIESTENHLEKAINILNHAGFTCEELLD